MPINKRWPILVAVGSAVAYVGNNYRIGGLEQLRLERRVAIQQDSVAGEYGLGDFPLPVSSSAVLPSVPRQASATSDAIFDQLPPWEPQLSVGEKLAVMQDRLSQKIGELAKPTQDGRGLPLEPPLTLPPGLERPRPSDAGHTGLTPNSQKSMKVPPGLMAGTAAMGDQVPSIRIASFCVQGLGATQLSKPNVVETLVSILRQFDVVALQGVQSDRDDILPMLVERLNQSGRRYDYVIGPRVGEENRQQFAFVFDTKRIETDRYQLYSIDDPENLMAYEPLVAWFRCKDARSEHAFTFSLVNLRVHPAKAPREQEFLSNLIHAVVNDGRREDDVILLGDFGGNTSAISSLRVDSVRHAIRDVPTDVSGERMLSGIILPAQATCEYTGRSGVLDFLRKYNLSLERALEISPQMPVWAEFYVLEGAQPGRVAPVGNPESL